MPACGQAVGCGVCDTPELWCGAAGLCARVRACAGAAESLHTYIHTFFLKNRDPLRGYVTSPVIRNLRVLRIVYFCDRSKVFLKNTIEYTECAQYVSRL